MIALLKSYTHEFLNLLYPPSCQHCGEPLSGEGGTVLCENCRRQIDLLGPAVCSRCGNEIGPYAEEGACPRCSGRPLHFRAARSIAKYDEPLREVIHRYKFGHKEFLAGFLTRLVLDNIGRVDLDIGRYDCIIPVPLHWRRKRERGFDQILPVTKALSRRFGVPLVTGVLVRHRYTTSQVRLSRTKRLENLKNAFSVRNQVRIEGKEVLIVDDIITTGATASECARTLKRAKAGGVDVLTIAR